MFNRFAPFKPFKSFKPPPVSSPASRGRRRIEASNELKPPKRIEPSAAIERNEVIERFERVLLSNASDEGAR